jgi:hypothetical protein
MPEAFEEAIGCQVIFAAEVNNLIMAVEIAKSLVHGSSGGGTGVDCPPLSIKTLQSVIDHADPDKDIALTVARRRAQRLDQIVRYWLIDRRKDKATGTASENKGYGGDAGGLFRRQRDSRKKEQKEQKRSAHPPSCNFASTADTLLT